MPSARVDVQSLRRWLTVAVVAMFVVAGCRPAPPPATPIEELAWTRVALPNGIAPSALAEIPTGLLLGGHDSTGGNHPALVRVDGSGTVTPVRLRPHSPYAGVADLSSLASSGTEVVALGKAYGGAHSNFRWTTWTGTSRELTEYPQRFDTFHGQTAGGLLDAVITTAGPVITGTWFSARGGLDAAVWLPRGEAWRRQESAGTVLANQADLQVAPRAATAFGSTVIIAGSVITFANGVRQSAAIWTWPGRDAAWQLTRLPEPGGRSEALSAACADQCWVSGHIDGQVALWRMGPGGAVREPTLPVTPIDVDGPGPRTVIVGGRPGVLLSHAGESRLLLQDGSGWQTLTAPDGPVRDAVMIGNRLYAIIGSELWFAEPD